ncbi:uncharacterized protein LOC116206848 [Punica granatum]|uniref:Uncharacterized protein LOC116206848 n=2 Tax=Punica granatum TaxID=22663 RepID=A0A6P8DTS7_PUNGR|nr:uncharacterized protein LOC116206848 [Punica granatum]PKI65158.1 hypothetical protein CRG98_014472 [Punica granatum]
MAASRTIPRTKPIPIGSFIPPSSDLSYSPQVGSPENIFEFDDSEDWTSPSYQAVVPSPNSRKADLPGKLLQPRKAMNTSTPVGATASSLPVSIPDRRLKILKDDTHHDPRHHRQGSGDDDDGNEEGEGVDCRLPPHEHLARRWGASLSVHEGIGRTLKGRDLRRVRNAIWKKVGFED